MALPSSFSGLIVRQWGKAEIASLPAFPLGEYDAACRILACSICAATDTHLVDGTFPRQWCAKPPFVLGHESAGRVVEIGPKVRNFKIGQMVVRPMWMPENFTYEGIGASWGGFSTWGIVRDTHACAQDHGQPLEGQWLASASLPDMPARDATLFVTWRDAMGCLLSLDVRKGQRVAVFGSGGNGLSFVRFASLMGAQVVMVGSPTRFDLAERLGALACIDYRDAKKVPLAVKDVFQGHGADIAIEAAGNSAGVPQLVASLADHGKIFLFGLPNDLSFPGNFFDGPEQYTIVKKLHDTESVGHAAVLQYYLDGKLNPVDFCNGEVPFEKFQEAFAAIRRKEAIKLTLTMPA